MRQFAQLLAEKCTSRGTRGVVGTAAPQAAAIGLRAFWKGGNAFDAALAAALAETVLVPSKCGLAGDLVALVQRPGAPLRVLIAIGTAPAQLAAAVSRLGVLPTTGGLSVGVPGAPAGYAEIARLGRLGLTEAAAPAIELAADGFGWSVVNYEYVVAASSRLLELNDAETVYLPGGLPIPPGKRVRMPGLAHALSLFADAGPALFEGVAGDATIRRVTAAGGVLTATDLASARAEWLDPVVAEIDGTAVWTTPAPTHGRCLLTALNRLADDVPVGLAVEAAIRERAELSGDAPGDEGTSVVAAADADGNAIVLVHSNSHPTFGSGIIVPELDLILSNRAGRGFSAQPGHHNFPEVGRRPLTTLHAWAVGASGEQPSTLGATSGGENQMVWNTQVVQRLRHGIASDVAVLQPLWAWGSDGAVQAEDVAAARRELPRRTPVTPCDPWTLPSGFQVLDLGAPMLGVTADIRSVGGTAGW